MILSYLLLILIGIQILNIHATASATCSICGAKGGEMKGDDKGVYGMWGRYDGSSGYVPIYGKDYGVYYDKDYQPPPPQNQGGEYNKGYHHHMHQYPGSGMNNKGYQGNSPSGGYDKGWGYGKGYKGGYGNGYPSNNFPGGYDKGYQGNMYPGSYDKGNMYPGGYDKGNMYPGSYDKGNMYPGSYDKGNMYPGGYDKGNMYPGSYDKGNTYPGGYNQGYPTGTNQEGSNNGNGYQVGYQGNTYDKGPDGTSPFDQGQQMPNVPVDNQNPGLYDGPIMYPNGKGEQYPQNWQIDNGWHCAKCNGKGYSPQDSNGVNQGNNVGVYARKGYKGDNGYGTHRVKKDSQDEKEIGVKKS